MTQYYVSVESFEEAVRTSDKNLTVKVLILNGKAVLSYDPRINRMTMALESPKEPWRNLFRVEFTPPNMCSDMDEEPQELNLEQWLQSVGCTVHEMHPVDYDYEFADDQTFWLAEQIDNSPQMALLFGLALRANNSYQVEQALLTGVWNNKALREEIKSYFEYLEEKGSEYGCAARKYHKVISDIGHGMNDEELRALLEKILTGPDKKTT